MRWLDAWIALGAVVGVTTVACVVDAARWPPPRRSRLAAAMLATTGLAPTSGGLAATEARVVARRRGDRLGFAAGLVGGFIVWSLVAAPAPWSPTWIVWLVAPSVAGAAVGGALALGRVDREAATPRVAHVRRRRIDDLVPPAVRWLPAAFGASAAALAAAFCVSPPAGAVLGRREVAVVAALVVGWGLVAELLAQWLVARPRAAASSAALAVCDEPTADMVGSLLASALPAIVLTVLVSQWLPTAATLVVVAVVAVRGATETARRRRVRERLWAEPPLASSAPPS